MGGNRRFKEKSYPLLQNLLLEHKLRRAVIDCTRLVSVANTKWCSFSLIPVPCAKETLFKAKGAFLPL
jgi:hypothetical protein